MRITRYGAAVALALVGVICGAVLPGTLGGTLATILIGIGLVGVMSLIFYEVGLSEDRDRARSTPRPAQSPPPVPSTVAPHSHDGAPRERPGRVADGPVRPRRLERRRGERRRLR